MVNQLFTDAVVILQLDTVFSFKYLNSDIKFYKLFFLHSICVQSKYIIYIIFIQSYVHGMYNIWLLPKYFYLHIIIICILQVYSCYFYGFFVGIAT